MQYAKHLKPYSLEEMKQIVSNFNGNLNCLYLHWSAGLYGQVYDDYHVSVDYDGKIYLPNDDEDLLKYRSHTWMRNGIGNIGIAMCACYKAVANCGYNTDFGEYPPTAEQIETMALLIAIFNKYGGVKMDDVLTHCEAAYLDGYGPNSGDSDTRWDFWYLPDSAYNGQMRGGGEVLRGKASWYLQQNAV